MNQELRDALAKLLRSDRVFLAARDVAEIEYQKHANAGVSVSGSVTAATRAALDVALGAIFDMPVASEAGTDTPSDAEICAARDFGLKNFGPRFTYEMARALLGTVRGAAVRGSEGGTTHGDA